MVYQKMAGNKYIQYVSKAYKFLHQCIEALNGLGKG